MKKIMFVSGHTDLNDSFVNKHILEALNESLPEAEFVYLDKLYPDFRMDVKTEQERLIRADVLVFQFPMFWYSAPSLLHRYMEQTFTHGFAHGRTGDKLKGKLLLLSFTSAAPEEMFLHDGDPQNYPMEEFLSPYRHMADWCGMHWGGYVHSGGLSYANRSDKEALEKMRKKAILHAARLIEKIGL